MRATRAEASRSERRRYVNAPHAQRRTSAAQRAPRYAVRAYAARRSPTLLCDYVSHLPLFYVFTCRPGPNRCHILNCVDHKRANKANPQNNPIGRALHIPCQLDRNGQYLFCNNFKLFCTLLLTSAALCIKYALVETETHTTTSAANGASASLAASNAKPMGQGTVECVHCHTWFLDMDEFSAHLPCERIINGRKHRYVSAYTTTSGKQIPAHWRPVRSCRSYAAQGVTPPSVARKPLSAQARQSLASAPLTPPYSVAQVCDNLTPKLGATIGAADVKADLDCGRKATIVPSLTQVDASLVPNVPEYYAQNGEVDLMQKAIAAELNVILTGPTGCGKTHLTERICMNAKREMFTIQGGAGATYERIIAQKDLVSDGNGATLTKLTKGILPTAMERGAVLYLDEPNAIPSEVLFYLFSAMDYRRTITLEDGSVIRAAKGFVVVGAMNEGAGYAGTALLNAAFRQRAVVIDMKYLPVKRETEVLTTRTGIDKPLATKLVDAVARLRSGAIKTPIGTRALLSCATLHVNGVSIPVAVEAAITNQIPAQFASERKAVSDVMAATFGMEVK